MNDAAEDEVLHALFEWEFFVGNDAWMRLSFRVLGLAIDPAFVDLLLHPRVVAVGGSRLSILDVEANSCLGAVGLPSWCFRPKRLAVVTESFAICPVGLVTHHRDDFDLSVGHAVTETLKDVWASTRSFILYFVMSSPWLMKMARREICDLARAVLLV